jgi:hypothetical protein
MPMRRLIPAVLIATTLLSTPALAATRTADAARRPGLRIAPAIGQPIRATLRTPGARRPRYELPQMMARNFGALGRRQLDALVVASR